MYENIHPLINIIVFNDDFSQGFIEYGDIGSCIPCYPIIKKNNHWIPNDTCNKIIVIMF